jgi:hypothetical protein
MGRPHNRPGTLIKSPQDVRVRQVRLAAKPFLPRLPLPLGCLASCQFMQPLHQLPSYIRVGIRSIHLPTEQVHMELDLIIFPLPLLSPRLCDVVSHRIGESGSKGSKH